MWNEITLITKLQSPWNLCTLRGHPLNISNEIGLVEKVFYFTFTKSFCFVKQGYN